MYDTVNTKFKSIQNCTLCIIGKLDSYKGKIFFLNDGKNKLPIFRLMVTSGET